jgi:hypothetical protein
MQKDSKLIAEAYLKKLNEGMRVVPAPASNPADSQKVPAEDEQTVDMDVQELGNVINLVASSNLPAVVKSNIQQLLKNTNVVSIYKQTKGVNKAGTEDADTVNLQPGSVSEPGSPSATTGAAPQQARGDLTYRPQQAPQGKRFSF